MKALRSLLLLPLLLSPALRAQEMPELLQQYCVKCHNFEDWAGGLDLESMDFEHVAGAAEEWEKVVRKIRAGMMPPAGEDRADRQTFDAFAQSLEVRLDAQVKPQALAPALHRLNRNEYRNAIRDLLQLDIDVSALLPQDDASEGFDNIAAGLGFSPALIQGYVAAAMKISRWAVGDMSATESSASYQNSPDLTQSRHLEGMPLGTRGGLLVEHNFPLDAEYDFLVRGGLGFGRSSSTAVNITLDGHTLQPVNTRRFRLPVSAGKHRMTAAVVDLLKPGGVNDIYSVYDPGNGIESVEIIGPFNATGPGDTASRRQIFSCYPQNNDEERRCAEQIVTSVASRAFRAPVMPDEIQTAMTFYEQGRGESGFEGGIEQALSRILIDPRFLFRFEEEPEQVAVGATYAISDIELASRLSFFLWSSIPDMELLQLAATEQLHQPAVLRAQVQRMLADQKAAALVDNFAGQWLHLRELSSLTPESSDFDENLRQAFMEETRLLFSYLIAEDRPVTELLNADYTFLNERLAKHYGIDGIPGSWFRKVSLPPDSPRLGLLGHGSILTITSTASRTSPVIRGSWILENLLSAPVPAPPPGVETNLDGDGSVVLTSSVRSRLEAHRADPSCASCHNIIDPVGFALEHFDAIGAWRDYDGDALVDTSGVLADGTPVDSAEDLRRALMSRSNLLVTTITEKLLTYALGRGLEYHDQPGIRSIMYGAAANNYRFSDLVQGIVQSPLFTHRIKSGNSIQTAQQATN